MNTDYNIRLKSGRIVEPGPGGFFWYWSSGQSAGHFGEMDSLILRMAAGEIGAVGVTTKCGDKHGITEFIPAGQIESVVLRVSAPSEGGPYR